MFSRGIELKKPDQLKQMRRAGLVVARILDELGRRIDVGVTTGELDGIAREMLAEAGATSNFLNYGAEWGYPPYPAVACISVDEQIVHGIPNERKLADGDIVSIDFGAVVDGWHGDAARTFLVGDVSAEHRRLSEITRESMWAGIGAARLGGRVGDISHAIEKSILSHGVDYGIVREYTGHGIGTAMHQPPDVPNYGKAGRGPKVVEGLVLAIEPMVTTGSEDAVTLDDEWTVVTHDGSWAAHWENTVTVTKKGLWVLTELDGGEAELAARGLPFGPLAD
ncbi:MULTISPECIES: type I methionyl aminopeptidase [unclassified Luteococcus]|uniref:type I methionyl aminopeptidase n=1 Tax=unclassified Luteococcus TaxID=2639923 RepID=UPI00313CFF8C